ncbi:MAG TPA: sensor histidine kinase [Pyrinomonadaceae bacterium]|nr:sensor histidine kinase [Pyrinomonadaceae bacterium]
MGEHAEDGRGGGGRGRLTDARLSAVPGAATAACCAVGCAVLGGWFLDISFLKSVLPGLPAMVPNTAAAFVLSGLALWARRPGRGGRSRARAAVVCASAAAALGALTLAEYAFDVDLRIDRMLLGGAHAGDDSGLPGRMSPHTSLSFLLSGVALLVASRSVRRGVELSQLLALAVGLVSLLALVGYTYSVMFLYGISPRTGMAVHTALTFGVLSAGVLLTHPRRGPVAVFTNRSVGGMVARRLLAAAVGVPLLLGWLTVFGQRAGLFEQSLGTSLLVVGSVVTFSALVWFAARLLDRVDSRRQRAEAARRQLLRRLVAAQEEERARLSRELHDKMGQHLTALALGLEVHGGGPSRASDEGWRRLRDLAEGLSQEVRDLAWELRPPELDHLGLKDAVATYAEQWSRRTGVAVDFVSAGGDCRRLTSEAETALYRVAQEALTNVVKHASARDVTLVLEQTPEQVLLVVEDNGRGFDAEGSAERPGARRKMGLLGMRERVELAGGSLDIESAAGAGTTLVARVPLRGGGEAG